MKEKFEKMIREMISIGFAVLLTMHFISTTKKEDLVVLVIIEVTFVLTRVYCSKDFNEKRRNWKGDKRNEDKKNDKRNG